MTENIKMKQIRLPFVLHTSLSESLKDVVPTANDYDREYKPALLCRDKESLAAGLAAAAEALGLSSLEDAAAEYDDAFFAVRALAAVFTDERSGANILTIDNVCSGNGVLTVSLSRERGLTADMSLRLLLIELPLETVGAAESAVCFITAAPQTL